MKVIKLIIATFVLLFMVYRVSAGYLRATQQVIMCYNSGASDSCTLRSRFDDWNAGVDFGIKQKCLKQECL